MRPYNSKLNVIIGNFRVIEDFGRRFPKPDSKTKAVFVKVECVLCGDHLEGQFTHFKYGARQCLKCFPKSWKIQKNYEGLIHGNFKIIKDLQIKEKRKSRKVIGQCIKCFKEYEHNYSSFSQLSIICDCKYELERTDDWIRIRKIYLGMVYRCNSEKCPIYNHYGRRGISVCDDWMKDKKNFYDWSINNGYAKCLTIDRIDGDKGYSPENCRWVTNAVQARNKKGVITELLAKQIKFLLLRKHTHIEIAQITGASIHAIACISKGATWTDI